MPTKLDNLTALRFFAAFAIFLQHTNRLGIQASEAMGGVPLAAGVGFFYVLSGFVLAYAYGGKRLTPSESTRFAAVRFFRLWPLHMVCTVAAVALLGLPDPSALYLYLTLQHTWVPTFKTAFTLNAVSWSISVELFFYLVFAVMLALSLQQRHKFMGAWLAITLVFLTAIWAGLIPVPAHNNDSANPGITDHSLFLFFPPIRIIEFFAGVATYKVFLLRRLPDRYVPITQVLAIVALVLLARLNQPFLSAVWPYLPTQTVKYLGLVWLFPFFALFIYVFAHQTGWVSRVLSNRALVFLGDISFASYMSHQLIIIWFAKTNPFGGDAYATAITAFAVTIVVSTALYLAVEMPTLRWAKKTFLPRGEPRQDTTLPSFQRRQLVPSE